MLRDPEYHPIIDADDPEVVYTFPKFPNCVFLDRKQIVAMRGRESEDILLKFTFNLQNTEPLLAKMAAEKLRYPTYWILC